MNAQPQLNKENIDEVLQAMTLEEKATLLVGSGWGSMTASSTVLVPGAAGTTRAIERLGIPQTVLSDGPAGLRISPTRPGDSNTYYCTGFPVGTVLASMWDTERVEELTTAMGNEVLEYGADVLLDDPVISEMEVSRDFIEKMEPATDIAIFTLSRNAGEGGDRYAKDGDYTEYNEGIYVGYRYFQSAGVPVSYPFGYGKSYTTFEYSKPVVKAVDEGFTATITVKNTGSVAGKEAVQLYVAAPEGGLEKPAYELSLKK